MLSWTTRLTLWLLRNKQLSIADRNALSTAILDGLEALPIRDIIERSPDGLIRINGRDIDERKLKVLKEAALAAIGNQALNLVADQVRYTAAERLLNKINLPEDLYFYRAGLWVMAQLKSHLQTLAETTDQSLL